MKKINFEKNTYFIGTDGSVYMEMQNIKEFIDEDNIKRYVVHLKDELKISKIKNENMLECKKKNIFDDRNNKGFVDFLKVELFEYFLSCVELENENQIRKMSPLEFFKNNEMFEYFKDIVISLDNTTNIIEKKLKPKYENSKSKPIEVVF